MNQSQWGQHRQRVEAYLTRIEQYNTRLNALWQVTAEYARQGADAADQAEREGRDTGTLHGMVVALKDNIDTAGICTTSGSKLYENYIPASDAEVWRRMRVEGAILIGKAGLHECVFGTTSQNDWYGGICNPWNEQHIPGGSSGGSGAVLAADFCDLALGTDTGGSVRIPAAMCGIAGLRPTMGAVSNRAVRPISPHLDTVGPMARNVSDLARVYAVMQAYDAKDETSLPAPQKFNPEQLAAEVKGLRIGIPDGYFYQGLNDEVAAAVKQAAGIFADLGAEIVTIKLELAEQAALACARIIVADAADYYRQPLQNNPDVFSQQTQRRMRTGFDVSGIEYASHMRHAYRWRRELVNQFTEVDLMLTPTLRIPAPAIAECDDLLTVTADIAPFTMAWALAGVPNLALPCGFSQSGLPISFQLAASHWQEAVLFQAGYAFQQATDYHTKTPGL